MPSSSASSDTAGTFCFERARPWLGTIASVQAEFRRDDVAGIEAAFAAIARVHHLMSFFDAASDLSRLHSAPAGECVVLDPLTLRVIDHALDLAQLSGGLFDPALGGDAVARGHLPVPPGAHYSVDEAAGASWRDIVRDGDAVVLARPLWLDLSGIAKGFAVDRALDALRAAGAVQTTVNIGGDMAVFGPDSVLVHLRTTADSAPDIEIADMALASSGGAGDWVATRHADTQRGGLVDPHRFATVLAPDCMAADGLTKVVLAAEEVDLTLLARYRARALRHDTAGGWQVFGGEYG